MRSSYVLAMLVSYILLLPACISCRLGAQGSGSDATPGASASGDLLQGERGEKRQEALRLE